jgi:hypothetical protein
MHKEDSLQFVQDRLRQSHPGSPLHRELHLRPQPRVTRRFVATMEKGEARTFERVDASVMVRCVSGSIWITHDGDPKDVIIAAREAYRAEREDSMRVFALEPSALEIEFEDDILEH